MGNLKIIFGLFFATFIVSSCTTTESIVYPVIQNLNRETKNEVNIYSVNDICFEDSIIKLCISIEEDYSSYILGLQNKTNFKLKVLWDEAVIVWNGQTSPIIHSGIKFMDKEKTQLPSVVLGNTKLIEYFTLSNNIVWQNGYGANPGYWKTFPIIESFSDKATISIPILIQDSTITYTSHLTFVDGGVKTVPSPGKTIGLISAISGGFLFIFLIATL